MQLVNPDALDPARAVMYDELVEDVGEKSVQASFDATMVRVLEQLYDMDSEARHDALGIE
jgi:hypothetical protein